MSDLDRCPSGIHFGSLFRIFYDRENTVSLKSVYSLCSCWLSSFREMLLDEVIQCRYLFLVIHTRMLSHLSLPHSSQTVRIRVLVRLLCFWLILSIYPNYSVILLLSSVNTTAIVHQCWGKRMLFFKQTVKPTESMWYFILCHINQMWPSWAWFIYFQPCHSTSELHLIKTIRNIWFITNNSCIVLRRMI